MGSVAIYKGIACELLPEETPFPTRLKVILHDSIPKALQEGFSYQGYPNEMMKEVTPEELHYL